jgi:hypothetical protein
MTLPDEARLVALHMEAALKLAAELLRDVSLLNAPLPTLSWKMVVTSFCVHSRNRPSNNMAYRPVGLGCPWVGVRYDYHALINTRCVK